ncbi:MAG: DUF1622 domain-containing protein [Candidatus Cloacimonetes bacterium]|nr:DUF1622 domain-containing protein [Candidatus Cloacimonadota bacterium]
MDGVIYNAVHYLTFAVNLIAIVVLVTGIVKAFWTFIKDAFMGEDAIKAISESRLELGHSFSLGLGFLIGSSIIRTTIAPTWNDIGQLAAIIALRTIMNFFLMKDIQNSKKL